MRLWFALALALLPTALAQTSPPPPASTSQDSETPTLTSRSTLVLVPALVSDKSGDLVFNLNADDFVLTDDGIPQKLTLEKDTGGRPLALVVLIEAGASAKSAGWHPGTRDAPPDRFNTLPTMIEALAGGVAHRTALVGFDSAAELLLDFTPDMDSVAHAIHDLSTNIDGDGGAAILDSLGFALDMLRRQSPDYRRAILLVSETNDRGSKLKLQQALHSVSDSDTAIYSLSYSTGNTNAARYAYRELPTKAGSGCPPAPYGGFTIFCLENANPGPSHGCMGKDDPNQDAPKNKAVRAYDCAAQLLPPLALAKMAAIATTEDMQKNIPETVARLTGGEYFKLTDAKSLETSLATISNHMPNRYVLTFQPQSPHPGFHFITLQLRNPNDLKVSSRYGYWADTRVAPTDESEETPR
jgi:hypothetical protein